MKGGVDHQVEALYGGRQFRDVVLGMSAADVLLHGAVPLFLWGREKDMLATLFALLYVCL